MKTDSEITDRVIEAYHNAVDYGYPELDIATEHLTELLTEERSAAKNQLDALKSELQQERERLRLAFMVSPFPNETCHTYKEWIDSMDAAILKHKSGRLA